jgi:acyl-coenzyme A synthetase/AMP-(fatty) acid ligase
MPAKIARLATRPPFWIPEVSAAVRSSRPSCSNAEKREYSRQIGSHPGNPGLSAYKASHSVQLISEIPRTGSGKIIRYKLRKLIKGESAGLAA